MMVAYWIARVTVTDTDSYGEYAQRATPAIESFGGQFLARSGRYEALEGEARARNVVVQFPTLEAAVECYNSPTYQAARKFADGACEREIVVVEGA